jgi:DNA mismatch endonuclease (patch repair protein)
MAPAQRLLRGDIMCPEKRSALMSRIRGKGTKPELVIAALLRDEGITFEEHARDLPGRPDFVLRDARVAVFVDGDFWHGWRFSTWRLKLSEKWEAKVIANRERDARSSRALRRAGWRVVRLWEHQVDEDPARCLERIRRVVARADARDRIGAPEGPGSTDPRS